MIDSKWSAAIILFTTLNVGWSLHLIVSVPIFLVGTTEHIPVEIQIRTIAMDYWASLEHHLKYKTETDVSDFLKCHLKKDADLLSAIDADLQDIFC